MDIVNDEYWLGYAKKKVDEAVLTLNSAAEKLSTLTATFWGIYTTVFTIGISLKKLEVEMPILVFMILPIPFLIAGYCFALWAQMPVFNIKDADPRIPVDIQKLYVATIRKKRARLNTSSAIVLSAAISLTITLCMINFTKEKTAKEEKKDQVEIAVDRGNLVITGALKRLSLVNVKVDSIGPAKAYKAYFSENTIVLNDTAFNYNKVLDGKAEKYLVTVSWKENETAVTSYSVTKAVSK